MTPEKTLRDEFAMAALTINDSVRPEVMGTTAVYINTPEEKAARIAHRAYLIADAILAERAKQKT